MRVLTTNFLNMQVTNKSANSDVNDSSAEEE